MTKRERQKECIAIGGCKHGEAVITKAYRLNAKWIIHAMAPKWIGGESGEQEMLKKTYISALELSATYDLKSIAFPLIGGGINGFLKEDAFKIAVDTFREFLKYNEMEINLVLYESF